MASDALERELTAASVGFQSKEEYKRKREEISDSKALSYLKRVANGGAGGGAAEQPAAAPDGALPSEGKKAKKEKKKAKQLGALSFGDDLDAEPEPEPSLAPKKIGKCQDVNVSFLALNEQEKQQAAEKQDQAMREILDQQRQLRAEDLTLRYTFRSEVTQREMVNAVHRGSVTVKRGWTADEVAVAVRTDVERLGGKFAPNAVQGIREERDVVLVCCCAESPNGSFVVPGAVSLVELSTRKWADAATPLFDDFGHGIVVTERRYYEACRHQFPFSTWRLYDSREQYLQSEYVATRGQAVTPHVPNPKPLVNGKPKVDQRQKL